MSILGFLLVLAADEPVESLAKKMLQLHLCRTYPDKVVTLEGKVLANIRQTLKKPEGEVIPVEEK